MISLSASTESSDSLAIIDMDDLNLIDDESDKSYVDEDLEEEATDDESAAESKVNDKLKKIGYGSVEDMPAQHIRLFAPWIFDPDLDVVQMYKDILSESDILYIEEALNEKDEYERLKNYFTMVGDILGDDRDAQNVMHKFLEVSPHAAEIEPKIYFAHPDILEKAFNVYWLKFLKRPAMPKIIDRICFSMPVEPILE
uniref:Uncharacterized protein n=1 Tax=Panagrolaimus sp. ES5 TaxID=591445 RepID=A0AC34GFJ0_9BILA